MATSRIKDLPASSAPHILPTDFIVRDRTSSSTNSVTISNALAALGARVGTVGSLSSPATGQVAYFTNGRKSGEGAGTGTGVLCTYNGTNWLTWDAGTAVAA